MRLPLRARWALWCAALVTASGALVVVITLAITADLLGDRTRDALDAARPAVAASPNRDSAPTPGSGGERPAPGPGGAAPTPGQSDARPPPLGDIGREVADSVFADVRLIGLGLAGGLAMVSLGVGWVVAGRMVRPVSEVTRVAGEVSGGRFGERIELDGPRDELVELASTFNSMLDRLDTAFDAQRSFAADASHELRTPLTVMRTEIDVALDDPDATPAELRDALSHTREAVDRASRLVDALLALSRSETLVHVTDHDLSLAARRSLTHHSLDDRRVDVQLEPATVRGDPVLIDRLIGNLIDNAVRYSPDGGRIDIRSWVSRGQPVFEVSNDGRRLSAAEVQRAFTRFDRAAREHLGADGTGLGLPIVAAIARTHGAQLDAEGRSEGGMRISVTFPAQSGSGRPDQPPV